MGFIEKEPMPGMTSCEADWVDWIRVQDFDQDVDDDIMWTIRPGT
jgi:hypothetical protein